MSLGVITVCEAGPAITIGCVGLHEPSAFEKKLLQLGAASAGVVTPHMVIAILKSSLLADLPRMKPPYSNFAFEVGLAAATIL
ncbi:MAG: hypothetical protein WDN29_02645 [Methylovirgula sp.]